MIGAPTTVVTGGAGFIGSNLVRHLLERTAARIVVFDRLTYAGSLENLKDVADHPRFVFVRGDIAERTEVTALFRDHRPDAVLNLAAESHVDRSIDDPGTFLRTNVLGTFELLEAARAFVRERAAGEAGFRLLHVSTDEVFGSLGQAGAFTESTAYAPRSPYSASKASADHLVRAYFHTYGLPTLVTNCSNNYGPYQFPEKLIPLVILNALEGRDLPVYGDGSNVRDWLHVEDHCAGLRRALERGTPGESYNLGGLAERSNLQVVGAVCAALEGLRPAAQNDALRRRGASCYRDLVRFVTDRPGHDHRYAIDPRRAAAELGFAPGHTFEQGLRATVAWYLDHREWCAAVGGAYQRERLGLPRVQVAGRATTGDREAS